MRLSLTQIQINKQIDIKLLIASNYLLMTIQNLGKKKYKFRILIMNQVRFIFYTISKPNQNKK